MARLSRFGIWLKAKETEIGVALCVFTAQEGRFYVHSRLFIYQWSSDLFSIPGLLIPKNYTPSANKNLPLYFYLYLHHR